MDCEDVPECIASARQQQLILFTGLDVANNASHAAVLAAFTQKRSLDRAPLRMTLLSADSPLYANNPDQALNKTKSPKFSRGYIKTRWMSKYVTEIPAVIVVFADLNWNHPSWNEKVTECESKISSLRAGIGTRGTRICVVLLQDGSVVTGDDPFAAERASKLCQSCQLQPKQLFVFPLTDQMLGFVVRLESAFHELAQAFYQQCIKQIRARSIPNNFSNLIIRQQFKLAFISELRQDTHTALRHYKLAYQNCIESEPAESELFEWRQVTGLINYKICQLSFLHSTALEAISQQRRHVSHMFATSPGQYPSAQLAAIEFALWKSKQCSMFADLFERAVVNGLAAMSTQHPGIHLHASADHLRLANELIDSMRSALSLSSSVADHLISPQPDPLQSQQSSWPTVVFYGQRPWRVSTESGGGLADSITENNARITLEQRCMPNHKRCLALLSSAMSQFKKYKCVRMQRHIMLLMADEYAALNHHSKALQFISHVLWECRIEKFTLPISLLLSRSLMSSFFVADLKEFVSSSVQILNIHSFPSFESISAHIAMNINRIRNAQPPLSPLPSFQLSDAQLIACQQQWMNVFSERVFFSLSAPRIDAFVRAHASFLCTEQAIASGSTLILKVSLYSCACVAMHFERLRVNVSDASTTTTNAERLPMFEFLSENIELKPNCETNFFYELNLDVNEFLETKLIVVSGLNLEFGSLHSCVYGTLDWEFTSLTMGVPESAYRTSMLDSRIGMPSIKVYPREASVRLEGDLKGDALLGQVANLSLKLVCDENEALPERLRVEWYAESCREDVPSSVQTATSTSTSITTAQSKSSPLLFLNSQNKLIESDELCVDIASLHTTETLNSPVEIPLTIGYCAQAVGTLCIVIKVFSTEKGGLHTSKRFRIPVQSKPPFNIRTTLLTLNNELIESPMMEIEFFARCDIETMAELVIGDIQWKPSADIELEEDELRRESIKEEGETCCEGDVLSVCACIRIPDRGGYRRRKSDTLIMSNDTDEDDETCSLGQICVKWTTSRNPKLWVLSQLDAGVVYPRRAPLSITAQICTSQCIVRTAIPILFSIKNLHSEPADLHITIEMTDLFMFAGNKEVDVKLLSSQTYECNLSVMALTAGRLPFPQLKIRSSVFESSQLDEIMYLSLPSSIFVLPQSKR